MHKRYRLTKRSDFQRVRGEGRSWAHPLVILYVASGQPGSTRVGFSVGKWVGKAVARNRAKRLLREVVRLKIHRMQTGLDIVLIARSRIVRADCEQVGQAVEDLLRRSRLLVEVVSGPVACSGDCGG